MTKVPIILVVDDNDDHRFITVKELSRLKPEGRYRVEQAASGAEALVKLRALMPAASTIQVLSDYRMPSMTGVELLKATRTAYPKAAIRFVIFSSMEQAAVGDQSLGLGADAFFVKPIELDDFRAKLRGVIDEWLSAGEGKTPARAK